MNAAAPIDHLLSLRRPDRPSRGVGGLLARLLPDPIHEAGWRRFVGDDLAELTPAERAVERRRLEVAIALADPDAVPQWARDRLKRLRRS